MNTSGLGLNLLRALDALLREGSTVRAADRLDLSQPAVSSALGRLRQVLGDPLFVRKGQGMEPTLVVRNLVAPVRDILERVEGHRDFPEWVDRHLAFRGRLSGRGGARQSGPCGGRDCRGR